MSTQEPRLKGNKHRINGPWPLGQFPESVIKSIGKQIVHRLAVGQNDISGDDFGTIFANAVEGGHLESPLGIADVIRDGTAWSVKTIKHKTPFKLKQARLISGRNSPDYSLGITDPHKKLDDTGRAVLSIWNARVNEALGEFDDLRVAVFIRNLQTKEFVLFEEIASRYAADDFSWQKNKGGNFEGYEKANGEHSFTWQSHGSQFTVIRKVPGSATRFIINQTPRLIEPDQILHLARFKDDWIQILG